MSTRGQLQSSSRSPRSGRRVRQERRSVVVATWSKQQFLCPSGEDQCKSLGQVPEACQRVSDVSSHNLFGLEGSGVQVISAACWTAGSTMAESAMSDKVQSTAELGEERPDWGHLLQWWKDVCAGHTFMLSGTTPEWLPGPLMRGMTTWFLEASTQVMANGLITSHDKKMPLMFDWTPFQVQHSGLPGCSGESEGPNPRGIPRGKRGGLWDQCQFLIYLPARWSPLSYVQASPGVTWGELWDLLLVPSPIATILSWC